MGFLKNLLTPHKHLKVYKGAAKALAAGDVKAGLDAAGMLAGKYDGKAYLGGKKPTPTLQPDAAGAMADPGDYMGDMEDPAYGSFTDPFTVEDFYDYADPGYAFELQQGIQSLMNGASAGSGAAGGAALKDLLKYSQGFARTGYNDAFNRFQVQQGNIFSRLSDIAHLGQNAAAGVGNQGTTLAGNAGQYASNAGSAAGAGIVGAGNAIGNGLTNYWLMQYMKPQPVGAGAGAV